MALGGKDETTYSYLHKALNKLLEFAELLDAFMLHATFYNYLHFVAFCILIYLNRTYVWKESLSKKN